MEAKANGFPKWLDGGQILHRTARLLVVGVSTPICQPDFTRRTESGYDAVEYQHAAASSETKCGASSSLTGKRRLMSTNAI